MSIAHDYTDDSEPSTQRVPVMPTRSRVWTVDGIQVWAPTLEDAKRIARST